MRFSRAQNCRAQNTKVRKVRNIKSHRYKRNRGRIYCGKPFFFFFSRYISHSTFLHIVTVLFYGAKRIDIFNIDIITGHIKKKMIIGYSAEARVGIVSFSVILIERVGVRRS